MTTNAICFEMREIASDSRWSYTQGDNLHYVDDTDFEKIAVGEFAAIICAGDAKLIEAWKDWITTGAYLDPGVSRPATETVRGGEKADVSIMLLARPDGELEFCKGVYITIDANHYFGGSGLFHAMQCFAGSKDIRKCVETAKVDNHTGGVVKYVNLGTGDNNLTINPKGSHDIHDSYQKKGKIMNLRTGKVVEANQSNAANTQPTQASDMHFSAPTGTDFRAWTKDDHQRLDDALVRIRERAKRARGE